mmetsp:Transcript_158350/g.485170  ORF Transcript_158350/g.485170 Transcript_158350/m.485170 type:complete len:236 (-) Transcript_158350:2-709(-)
MTKSRSKFLKQASWMNDSASAIRFCISALSRNRAKLLGPPARVTASSKCPAVRISREAAVSAVTVKLRVSLTPNMPRSPTMPPGATPPIGMTWSTRWRFFANLPDKTMAIQSPGAPWLKITCPGAYSAGMRRFTIACRKGSVVSAKTKVLARSRISCCRVLGSCMEAIHDFSFLGSRLGTPSGGSRGLAKGVDALRVLNTDLTSSMVALEYLLSGKTRSVSCTNAMAPAADPRPP